MCNCTHAKRNARAGRHSRIYQFRPTCIQIACAPSSKYQLCTTQFRVNCGTLKLAHLCLHTTNRHHRIMLACVHAKLPASPSTIGTYRVAARARFIVDLSCGRAHVHTEFSFIRTHARHSNTHSRQPHARAARSNGTGARARRTDDVDQP